MGRVVLALLAVAVLSGCAAWKRPKITGNGTSVIGVQDGTGVSLASGKSGEVLPLPAGSKLTVTKTEAVQAIPATPSTPAQAAQPAREVTEVVVSKDTTWRKEETTVVADTGSVDTSVARHRIDAAENRYLLFAAIGAAVAALLFVYIKYPTPALMCGAASVVFFLAWRLSGLPDYFWVIGVVAGAGAIFLWKGHERGEKDGVKAAVSGNIESPTPKVVP